MKNKKKTLLLVASTAVIVSIFSITLYTLFLLNIMIKSNEVIMNDNEDRINSINIIQDRLNDQLAEERFEVLKTLELAQTDNG